MGTSDPTELREAFSHFDRDGNGTIDPKELSSLLEALQGEAPEAEELAIAMDVLDTNENGVIEFSEFVAWWTDR